MLLTVESVSKAAAEYYKAGLLTAQAEKEAKRICVYKSDNYRCAIGAAMDEDSANSLGGSIGYLISAGVVSVLSDDEAIELRRIQNSHDVWCSKSKQYGRLSQEAGIAEVGFLKAINFNYEVAA